MAVTAYEQSLITILRNFQTDYSNLSDFTIICENGEELKSHRLLLAARSKYFEALFRQEPNRNSLEINFESSIMQIIINSLISIDLTQLEDEELQKLLEISDYLQMDTLTSEIETTLTNKLTIKNIYDIVDFTENLQVSKLKSNFTEFIKQNILQLDLKDLPKWNLKTLTLTPTGYIKDQHGRLYDLVASELILYQELTLLGGKNLTMGLPFQILS